MPETNFDKVIEDFDGFMRDHGYVRTKEWARINNVSRGTPNVMIDRCMFGLYDCFKVGHVYYISLERDKYKEYGEDFKAMIEDFEGYMRDHGYIRTSKYAEENFQSPSTVRHWYLRKTLIFPDVVKIGEVYYIRKDVDILSKLKRRGPKKRKEK